MDYASVLCDPLYATIGIAATLTPNRPDATGVTVTVIERTTSVDASDARLIVEEPDQLGSSAARTSTALLTPDATGRPELE